MKKNTISVLVVIISLFSFIVSLVGVLSMGGTGKYEFISLHGEKILIYGEGIYKSDSFSMAIQAIAQDFVTILLGIPLLIISLVLYRNNSFRGKILLTGTVGYFLYTYTSYSFLAMYNHLFIVYILIMSLSFFAFVILMMSYKIKELKNYFRKEMPVKLISSFLVFLGIIICLMWLGRLAPSVFKGELPIGLEHYTTLVIQALDLGFIVPLAIISGLLVRRREGLGYLLSSIIIIKGITLLTAISTMVVLMFVNDINVSPVEIIVFPLFNLTAIYCLYKILQNTYDKVPE